MIDDPSISMIKILWDDWDYKRYLVNLANYQDIGRWLRLPEIFNESY